MKEKKAKRKEIYLNPQLIQKWLSNINPFEVGISKVEKENQTNPIQQRRGPQLLSKRVFVFELIKWIG